MSLASLGFSVGLLTALLSWVVDGAAALFSAHPALVWLLPVAGFASYGLYRLLRVGFSWSTAQAMEAARDGAPVPWRLFPAIIVATALTVLCGGSVGKEAAALQVGAAVSSLFSRRAVERLRPLLAPSAMAAALGAMLGAPLAGVVFSFEALRRMPRNGAAFAAPLICSLVACATTSLLGVRFLAFPAMAPAVAMSGPVLALAMAVGVAAAILALLFCGALSLMRQGLAKLGAPLFSLAAGGAATALLLGYGDLLGYGSIRFYCGTGALQIALALEGASVAWWGFAVKAALTLLTFAGGFKGGEILPVLAIGAGLGAAVAQAGSAVLPALAASAPLVQSALAAAAMTAFFAACTNCPLTAIVLSLGFFGPAVLPAVVVAVAFAFPLALPVTLYPTTKTGRGSNANRN